MEGVVVASRYWGTSTHDVSRLAEFIERAALCRPDRIIVAVNVDEDKSNAVKNLEVELESKSLEGCKVSLLPLACWEGITGALNALLGCILQYQPLSDVVVFQSIEVNASAAQLQRIVSEVRTGALVCGGAFDQHHPEGGVSAKVPWNTLAAWDLEKLDSIGGFPAAADKVSPPGMEEVGAVCVAQRKLGTSRARSVICCFEDRISWLMNLKKDRLNRHVKKMESKERRSNEILNYLGATDLISEWKVVV